MVKFQQLNDSMQLLVTESQEKSKGILTNIGDKVKERGNKQKEVKALEQAKKLHTQTTAIIDKIETYKVELIELTGGYMVDEETGENIGYLGMKDADNTSMLMVGIGDNHKQYPGAKQKSKDGLGYAWSLQVELNEFVKTLNKAYVDVDLATGGDGKDTKHFGVNERLALDGKEDPLFMKDAENKNKTWPMLNFDHTPMIASLAFLTEKQAKLAQYEGEILAKLKGVVGAADFKFDKLDVMANADASTVAAGTEYKASIFLTAFSDKMAPVMTAGGRKLKVTSGMGEYKFRASLPKSKPNKDGLYPASYNAVIQVPDPLDPSIMKKFTKKVNYFVSKPVIQVKAGDINALYKDCGNPLNIQVPALGALYAPTFVVSGGSQRKGPKGKGSIVVIPNKAEVAITVKSGGNTIGTEKFKVRLVPKPTIMATTRGKQINPKGVLAPGPRKVVMKAVAEPGFKAALPKDSKFRVTKWTATLVRGKRPVVSPKTFKKPEGNLTAFASKAKNGDRIMIEVKKVFRRTYTGKNVEVRIPVTIINVPLTD
jgi:gliding motility-associated protein GldM